MRISLGQSYMTCLHYDSGAPAVKPDAFKQPHIEWQLFPCSTNKSTCVFPSYCAVPGGGGGGGGAAGAERCGCAPRAWGNAASAAAAAARADGGAHPRASHCQAAPRARRFRRGAAKVKGRVAALVAV